MTPARAMPDGTDTVSGTPPVVTVSIACGWSELEGMGLTFLRSLRGCRWELRHWEFPRPADLNWCSGTRNGTGRLGYRRAPGWQHGGGLRA